MIAPVESILDAIGNTARPRAPRRGERRWAHRLAELLGLNAVIVTLASTSGFEYMSVAPYAD